MSVRCWQRALLRCVRVYVVVVVDPLLARQRRVSLLRERWIPLYSAHSECAAVQSDVWHVVGNVSFVFRVYIVGLGGGPQRARSVSPRGAEATGVNLSVVVGMRFFFFLLFFYFILFFSLLFFSLCLYSFSFQQSLVALVFMLDLWQ